MRLPFSTALRSLPLLAMAFLLAAHALSGGHRSPARFCKLGGRTLLLFPGGSGAAAGAAVEKLDAQSCEVAPSALLLLDELPLPSFVSRFVYVGARVAPSGFLSAARVSNAPPGAGWPAGGEWANVLLSPPGNFSIPLENDLSATPGAATREGSSLRVQWLGATGEAEAMLCDLPELRRCETTSALPTPGPLRERAQSFARACDDAWRASPRARRALAPCAVARWNRALASCPASLSPEEDLRLGAELASVPFFHWRRPELDRMRECPTLARNETVKAFLEMRLGKTVD